MALSVVAVAEPVTPGATGYRRHGPDDPEGYVTRLAEAWRRDGLDVTGEAVYDPISPAQGLKAHLDARPAGLVALTTHARAGLRRVASGSAAADIVHASLAPADPSSPAGRRAARGRKPGARRAAGRSSNGAGPWKGRRRSGSGSSRTVPSVPTRLSPRLAAIVSALPVRPHSRALEVGCGPGAAARAVAARLVTGHVLAIDRSAVAVAQARATAADEIASGRMSVRQVTAEDLVLEAGEEPYDVVLAVRVGALDGRHPKAGEQALRRIAVATRPGARLFVGGGDPLRELPIPRP